MVGGGQCNYGINGELGIRQDNHAKPSSPFVSPGVGFFEAKQKCGKN